MQQSNLHSLLMVCSWLRLRVILLWRLRLRLRLVHVNASKASCKPSQLPSMTCSKVPRLKYVAASTKDYSREQRVLWHARPTAILAVRENSREEMDLLTEDSRLAAEVHRRRAAWVQAAWVAPPDQQVQVAACPWGSF